MIENIAYKMKLSKLFNRRSKIIALYQNERELLLAKHATNDQLQELLCGEKNEITLIDNDIETLSTSFYLKQARIHFLDIPKWDDDSFWVESSLDEDRKVLSNRAIGILHEKIREDRSIRIDQISKLITTFTGLAGVLTGIIAILVKSTK